MRGAAARQGGFPGVFTLADLKQRCHGDEQAAMEMARRWLESGQVRQVAPPRPVFIRLNGGDPLALSQVCLALRRAFPAVVIVGGSALWRQGMSQERDALLDCVVGEPASSQLPGVRLHQRPPGWLAAVSAAGGLSGELHGVPMLSAEMAVADATAFAGVWVPDRKALDWRRLSASALTAAEQALAPLRPEPR